MTEIPPAILLDPEINKSLGDILNYFPSNSFVTIVSAKHSSNCLHFTSVVKSHDGELRQVECYAPAVIKYNTSNGRICLIYFDKVYAKK